MKLTTKELNALLRLVEVTEDAEIDCDEFLSRVSAYLERLLADDGATAEAFPEVVQHLKICPECREEFEAMLRTYETAE